ncbi:uncharacterized protein METZ01_LOCUS296157 [marine metagenome]|uniref:Ribosome-associated protein n=1 Tax=marine metagenome TaxID=408172 RepID=A0A382M348_9ZZZZ
MGELRKLATRLAELNQEQINQINDAVIKESVEATRKITKGNARKRQIQYTAKLLSKIDTTDIRQLVDTLDASSALYVQKFHSLESWRERLIQSDDAVLNEIFLEHPDCDRQQLRQLTRTAIKERASDGKGAHFRKLFQFLKQLS